MHTNASAILGPNQKNIVKWVKNGGYCVFVRLKMVKLRVFIAVNQIPSASIEFKHQVKNAVTGDHHKHMSFTFSFPASARVFNSKSRSIPNKLDGCYISLDVKICSDFNFFQGDFSVNIQLIVSMFALRNFFCLLSDPHSK